jgi:uncharacterized membrane protein HdeD (DUF308 family)
VADAPDNARTDHRAAGYWTVPLVRAASAVVPAILITFTANHSPEFGLVVFGAFAFVSGIVVAVLSRRTLADSRERTAFLVQGVAGAVAGALALVFHGGGLGFFLYLVTVWGLVTGFLELSSGIRARRRDPADRDWLVVGATTALFAVVLLVLPPNVVVSVGLFGAYLVLLAVYLGIAAFSLKWAPAAAGAAAATSASGPATVAPTTATPNDSDTQ